MKRNVIIFIIFISLLAIAGCSEKNKSNTFESLTSKAYSSDLTLEEGYDMVLPFAKNWAQDAVLTKYTTNIPTSEKNYKSHLYAFDSLAQKKTLVIGYNQAIPDQTSVGDPQNYQLTNHFITKEIDWTKQSDWAELFQQETAETREKLSSSKFNNVKKYINSEEIIKAAEKEGLNDFINQYRNLDVKQNSVYLIEFNNIDFEWQVTYYVGQSDSLKFTHTFLITFNPSDGKVIKKSVK